MNLSISIVSFSILFFLNGLLYMSLFCPKENLSKIFLQLTFKQLIIQIDNKDIIIIYEFTIKNNVSPKERITPTILNILDVKNLLY